MNPLVTEISTAYKVTPGKVEQLIEMFGQGPVEAALTQVKRLPIRPDSPFGWMISQLRAGKIDPQVGWLAWRYCAGFHRTGTNTITTTDNIAGPCPVCGKEATA